MTIVQTPPDVDSAPGGIGTPLDGAPVLQLLDGNRDVTQPCPRHRVTSWVSVLGPAFVASIAYVDPGNFATNIQSGSEFGYLLIWVVVLANAMAMIVQYLSAKLGAATGLNLPEVCRQHVSPLGSRALWLQAEIVAAATDVGELIGAALGLNLLFGIPMAIGGAISASIAFAILRLESGGFRRFELTIGGLLLVIATGFAYEVWRLGPSDRSTLSALVPHFAGHNSLILAAGIVDAKIMPHAVYLHSDLIKKRRSHGGRTVRQIIKLQKPDIVVALGVAGIINVAMLVIAAKTFYHARSGAAVSIQQAHAGFGDIAGGMAALAFAVALFASGVSSSTVGTYAGQVVMQGFTGRSIPVVVRRAVTVAPALLLLLLGVNATEALIVSQVVLSFGIPFALVPLVIATAKPSIMGEFTNRRSLTAVALVIAAVVAGLNVVVIGTVL
jgi:manganese transport protein